MAPQITLEDLAKRLGSLGLGIPQPPSLSNKQRKALLEDYLKISEPKFDEAEYERTINLLTQAYADNPKMLRALDAASAGFTPDSIQAELLKDESLPIEQRYLNDIEAEDLKTFFDAYDKRSESERERMFDFKKLAKDYGLADPEATFSIPEEVVKEYFMPKATAPIADKSTLMSAATGLLGARKGAPALASVKQKVMADRAATAGTKSQLENMLISEFGTPFENQIGLLGAIAGLSGGNLYGGGGDGGGGGDRGAPPPRGGNYMGEGGRMYADNGKRYATWEEVAHGYDPELDVMYRDVTPSSRAASDEDYTRAKKYYARRWRI